MGRALRFRWDAGDVEREGALRAGVWWRAIVVNQESHVTWVILSVTQAYWRVPPGRNVRGASEGTPDSLRGFLRWVTQLPERPSVRHASGGVRRGAVAPASWLSCTRTSPSIASHSTGHSARWRNSRSASWWTLEDSPHVCSRTVELRLVELVR